MEIIFLKERGAIPWGICLDMLRGAIKADPQFKYFNKSFFAMQSLYKFYNYHLIPPTKRLPTMYKVVKALMRERILTRLVSFLSPFWVMRETIFTMLYIPIIIPIIGVILFLLSFYGKGSRLDFAIQ